MPSPRGVTGCRTNGTDGRCRHAWRAAAATSSAGVVATTMAFTQTPLPAASSRSYVSACASQGVGSPVALWMARPPLSPFTLTPYVVYGRAWPAPNLATHLLPFGLGAMTFLPAPLAPGDPFDFVFADGGGGPGALVPAWPALFPGPGTTTAVTAPISVPVSFALQGLIPDASAPAGVAVTNAVRVILR